MKKTVKDNSNLPFYKRWQFWVIIGTAIFIFMVFSAGRPSLKDYTGVDAKQAYEELLADGHAIKFSFDRNNNGGFSEDDFQDFVIKSFSSDNYAEMPFTVTKQSTSGEKVNLSIDYTMSVEAEQDQSARNEALEKKLGVAEAMTACKLYGERNYRDFKLHSILGKIAEYASDDDTWFLKYTVDANGYNDLTMECHVTGTSESPVVEGFSIY